MKKITFLFALLCASVMGWATDWTGSVTGHVSNVWLDGIGSNEDRTEFDYSVNYLVEYESGTLAITIDYATANFDKIVGLVPKVIVNGAYAGDFSSKRWSSSSYSAGTELHIYFQFDYNGGGNGSSQFTYTIPGDETPEDPSAHWWDNEAFLGSAIGDSYANKYKMIAESGVSIVNIQGDPASIYVNTATDVGLTCSLESTEYHKGGAAMFLHLSAFTAQERVFTITNANGTFTCKVYNKDGASSSDDTEKPSMAEATVSKVSQTHNSVVISITGASDNVGVTKYVVKNHSDNSSVGEYTPAENRITVSGLSPETAYNWDIYAKDAAGNVSDNSKNISFTTDALVSNYCGETLTNGDHSIALTCEKVSADNYRIIIEGSNLNGLGGTFYNPGGVDLRSKITSSSSTQIVCDLDAEPTFYTALFVMMPGEVSFSWPNDVIWGTCPAVAVTGVTLNESELNMQVGGATQTLVATVAPANASNKAVSWSSNHPEIASVENGVITANAEGQAIITVTTEDGSYTDQCTVNVTVPSITPVTYNGYCSDGKFFVKYAITRTSNKDLAISANIEWLPTYSGVVAQIWRGGDHINLAQSGSTFTGTFLSDLTDGDVLNLYFRFEYALGATGLEAFNYTVGSEQAVPASIPVGAVVLNKASNTLSVGETDNLTATVYPSFATSAGSITWASDAPAYATVDAGTVTAVAAPGTANITATCGGVTSVPCEITVAASLAEAKYYGIGTFTDFSDEKNAFAYEFCFTRASDHNVTLDVVFSQDMTGIISNDNFRIYVNGDNKGMTYNASTKTASYDFGKQSDGTGISYYFYFIMTDGVHQPLAATYTVGSSHDKVYACVVDEDIDNAAVLAAYDGRTAQVIVDRSFAADNLYTLVLPFSADAEQTAAKLPGSLTKLNNTIIKDNEDLRVNFVNADAIEAGVPYLYTPSADVVNPVFADVTIDKDLNPSVPADGYASYYGIYAPLDGDGIHALSDAYVLGSDQYLYSVANLPAEQTMKALRGYFVLNFPVGSSQASARVVFNTNEVETATGMESIQSSAISVQKVLENGQVLIIRDGRTYNAQGQMIK